MATASKKPKRGAVTTRSNQQPKPIAVAVFWRNDQDDGLGIIVGRDGCLVLDGLQDSILDALHVFDVMCMLDQSGPKMIEAQLREMAQRKDRLEPSDVLTALGYVTWLEARGHIETDENNGVLWAYEVP